MASLTTTPSRVLRSPTSLSLRFLRLDRLLLRGRLLGLGRRLRARLLGRRLRRRGWGWRRRHRRRHRGRRTAALADDRVGPGEVAAGFADPRRVLGHAHGQLEPEVEDLLGQLPYLLRHLVVREVAPLGRLHRVRVRVMNLVEIPILLAAVRNASLATSTVTPSIS